MLFASMDAQDQEGARQVVGRGLQGSETRTHSNWVKSPSQIPAAYAQSVFREKNCARADIAESRSLGLLSFRFVYSSTKRIHIRRASLVSPEVILP